jgi:alpha-1,2-mannosyltransferase
MKAAHAERGPALLAAALLVPLVLHFGVQGLLRPLARPYTYSDFATFYSAARAFSTGSDPYDTPALRAAGEPEFGGWIGRYFYPPPFAAVVVRPLSWLPFEVARRLWVVLEAAAYLAAAALLSSALPFARRRERLAGTALVALPYAPVFLDLKLGSVSGLLLLLVVLFGRARQRRHEGRAALWLAAAVLLKLAPGLIVLYLAGRGEWRTVARVGLGLLGLAAAALPWTGVRAYADYATQVLPELATANFSWFTNQSLDAFFWRLLVPNPDTTPWLAAPGLQRVLAAAAGLVVLGAVALLARGSRRPSLDASGRDDAPAIATVLVAALLLARVTWEYMLVLALPALVHAGAAVAGAVATPRRAALAALAWSLCALPLPYAEAPLRSGLGLLLEAPRTYGLLLLLGFGVLQWTAPPAASQRSG